MDDLLDLFKIFSIDYCSTHGWDSPASVWEWDSSNIQWRSFVEDKGNPYELIPALAVLGYHNKSMLVVHGWASPYTEGQPMSSPSLHPEKLRVRAFTYLQKETIITAYQIMGEDITEVSTQPQGGLIDELISTVNIIKNYSTSIEKTTNE